MKVLHVIPSISLKRGGPSVYLRGLARGLHDAGIHVEVAATDDHGSGRAAGLEQLDPEGSLKGIPCHLFPRQVRFYTQSWPLRSWLKSHIGDYDLVHVHALFSFSSTVAGRLALSRGIPLVVRPLGTLNRWGREQRWPLLKRLSFSLLERRILEGASAIHYTSEQEKIEAEETGFRARRSFVVPNFVDMPPAPAEQLRADFQARHSELARRPWLLFLSRIDPKKGLDLLITAIGQLRREGLEIELGIAGEGEAGLTGQLRAQSRREGVADLVHWLGFLSGREKWEAYAAADAFVLPSHSENFGIAAVEAMAASRPVIVSEAVGISPDVYASGAGLVSPSHAGELAGKIRELWQSSTRSEMGERGRALVAERFSRDAVVAQVLGMYEAVLQLPAVDRGRETAGSPVGAA